MPQAALAAVVVAYSVGLIEPIEFRAIRAMRRKEFRWAVIAFVGVVLLGTLQGIVVAVIASLLALAQQAYHPTVHVLGRKRGTDVFRPRSAEHPDDESWPGLLIVRVEGRAFFLNAQRIGDRLWPLVEQSKPAVLLLDGRALIDIEYTALKMLIEAEEKLRQQGVAMWMASLNPEVLKVVQQSRSAGRWAGAHVLQRAGRRGAYEQIAGTERHRRRNCRAGRRVTTARCFPDCRSLWPDGAVRSDPRRRRELGPPAAAPPAHHAPRFWVGTRLFVFVSTGSCCTSPRSRCGPLSGGMRCRICRRRCISARSPTPRPGRRSRAGRGLAAPGRSRSADRHPDVRMVHRFLLRDRQPSLRSHS